MKKLYNVFLFTLLTLAVSGQDKPKLIVGIVVDQMRYDYLLKFADDFGDGGFKELQQNGFNCTNVNYNYKPTYTGPGHASIFTGTTPAINGIVANNWYDRSSKRKIYCVTLFDEAGNAYNSPERLKSETFSDGMKQYFGKESKVYGVSLKDRGAILPVGHLADGAYWFNDKTGQWVTSSYYTDQQGMKGFNETDFNAYLKNGWTLSLPVFRL